MLVIEDADLENAAKKLRLAGFQDSSWSYGAVHPSFYTGKLKEGIYRGLVEGYSNLDQNSIRFLFPPEQQTPSEFHIAVKVVLVPASYAHIDIKSLSNKATREKNLIHPDGAILLLSFIQTALRAPAMSKWRYVLEMWAISYVYGELMLDDDTLDTCDDEEAKAWFNEHIRRFSGGIDRVTCFKRLGRVGYNKSLGQER